MSAPKDKKRDEAKAVNDSDPAESGKPAVDRSKKPKSKEGGSTSLSASKSGTKLADSKENGSKSDAAKDAHKAKHESESDSVEKTTPVLKKKKSSSTKAKPPPSSSESDEESDESETSSSSSDAKPVVKPTKKSSSVKVTSQADSPTVKRSDSKRGGSTSSAAKKQPKKVESSSDEESDEEESDDDVPSDRDVETQDDLLDPDSSSSEESEEPAPKPKKEKGRQNTSTASTGTAPTKEKQPREKGSKKPDSERSPRSGSSKKTDDEPAQTPKPQKNPSSEALAASSKKKPVVATPRSDSESSPPLPDSDVDETPKKAEIKPSGPSGGATDDPQKKKKSGGLLASLFGKKKTDSDKPSAQPAKTERVERKVIYIGSVSDLSEDIQKKLKKAKISDEKIQKNLRILLNVLHFLTKDSYRMPGEDKDPPRERRPYATAAMIESAKQMIQIPDNIKKYYRSIEFSGKGGFGRVFAAKDVATKRRVAIKRVPHVTEKDKRNNYCEVAFLSQCRHPNVVNYIKAWEVKDEAWIVTEFLEGGTLSEAVKVHQFSERHIAYVAREILKALKYLHSINFVHRDLKSGNVMMSIEGHIKLIDFGLCCEVGSGERVQMLGSPYWIPPEMIKRKPHGCPADIWSFAVCVLEMFLKEPPNAQSRLYAMFTAAADGIADAIPTKASPMAKDFLSKCLIINPAKRASAEELLQHPFVTQPKLEEGIKDVLRGVFVSNSLALSGI